MKTLFQRKSLTVYKWHNIGAPCASWFKYTEGKHFFQYSYFVYILVKEGINVFFPSGRTKTQIKLSVQGLTFKDYKKISQISSPVLPFQISMVLTKKKKLS